MNGGGALVRRGQSYRVEAVVSTQTTDSLVNVSVFLSCF